MYSHLHPTHKHPCTHISVLPTECTFNYRYEIRYRNDWQQADTVYDAWLLREGKRRSAFDFDKFTSLYPQWNRKNDGGSPSSISAMAPEPSSTCMDEKPIQRFHPLTTVKDTIVISSSNSGEDVNPRCLKPSSNEDVKPVGVCVGNVTPETISITSDCE